MAKITGIGGVFFKSRNNDSELAAWYEKNLGLDLESWGGSILRWPDDKAEDGGRTVWRAADNDTKWFSPSESSFMINYRVYKSIIFGRIARVAAAISFRGRNRTKTESSHGALHTRADVDRFVVFLA